MLIHGEPNCCLRLGRLVFDSLSVGFFSTCLARSLAFLRSSLVVSISSACFDIRSRNVSRPWQGKSGESELVCGRYRSITEDLVTILSAVIEKRANQTIWAMVFFLNKIWREKSDDSGSPFVLSRPTLSMVLCCSSSNSTILLRSSLFFSWFSNFDTSLRESFNFFSSMALSHDSFLMWSCAEAKKRLRYSSGDSSGNSGLLRFIHRRISHMPDDMRLTFHIERLGFL